MLQGTAITGTKKTSDQISSDSITMYDRVTNQSSALDK